MLNIPYTATPLNREQDSNISTAARFKALISLSFLLAHDVKHSLPTIRTAMKTTAEPPLTACVASVSVRVRR